MATPVALDPLIRKETALGFIREIVPPQTHLGLQLVPFLPVDTDDVIFEYAKGLSESLAPARAEDAESELAQKDDTLIGQGRASVIDWSLKDHYTASDVNRYREMLQIAEQIKETQTIPLTVNSAVEGFSAKLARDTARRRRALDNRIEWLIMSALATGAIGYNDGKIKFSVDFGRPSGQQAIKPKNAANGTKVLPDGSAMGDSWLADTSDPIGDCLKVQQFMFDTYGVRIERAMTSRKVLNNVLNSSKFAARSGIVVPDGSGGMVSPDMRYLVDGWGPAAAIAILERATGIKFFEYDSVYRTRALGSTTFVNNRFFPETRILFLPADEDVNLIDDTEVGFAKTLTSPHPAGQWSSGFYEWQYEYGVDPWGYDAGNGIKAFPVFPHMDLTLTYDVLDVS